MLDAPRFPGAGSLTMARPRKCIFGYRFVKTDAHCGDCRQLGAAEGEARTLARLKREGRLLEHRPPPVLALVRK
jgi:hypothetical protein